MAAACLRAISRLSTDTSSLARACPVCASSTRLRAARASARRLGSARPVRARITSPVLRAMRIASPSGKRSVRPGQSSLMMGVPQAAASKSRTLGDQPIRRIAARVTLSVNRWRL